MAIRIKAIEKPFEHDLPRLPRRATATTGIIPATALFILFLALYCFTRTYYNTYDAVASANEIGRLYTRTGGAHWLYNPRHLLFNAGGYALWHLTGLFGYKGGPLAVLEAGNAVLAALGISIFYLTLRSLLHRSRWIPLLVACGLGLSFGYWICATDARVNMPSIVLLLAAFFTLCRLMATGRMRYAVAGGMLSGGAFLYHESMGLFVGLGVAAAFLAQSETSLLPNAQRLLRRRLALLYIVSLAATIGLPYLLITTAALKIHSAAAFQGWLYSSTESGWWWNFDILHNLRLDAYALRRAAFAEPPGKQGTFHVSSHVPATLLALFFATLAGWFIAVYSFFVALPLLWRTHHRPILILCVLWLMAYGAFFTVRSPGYFVFWVPMLVPTSLLLALSMAHYRAHRAGVLVNWLIGLWIFMFATVNLVGNIAPKMASNSDPYRRMAMDVRSHTQPGDLIVLAGAGYGAQCEVDIPYFADRDCLSLQTIMTESSNDPAGMVGTIQSRISDAISHGKNVYALDEIWHDPDTFNALRVKHPRLTRPDVVRLFRPWSRTPAWDSPRGTVWRIAPHQVSAADYEIGSVKSQ